MKMTLAKHLVNTVFFLMGFSAIAQSTSLADRLGSLTRNKIIILKQVITLQKTDRTKIGYTNDYGFVNLGPTEVTDTRGNKLKGVSCALEVETTKDVTEITTEAHNRYGSNITVIEPNTVRIDFATHGDSALPRDSVRIKGLQCNGPNVATVSAKSLRNALLQYINFQDSESYGQDGGVEKIAPVLGH